MFHLALIAKLIWIWMLGMILHVQLFEMEQPSHDDAMSVWMQLFIELGVFSSPSHHHVLFLIMGGFVSSKMNYNV